MELDLYGGYKGELAKDLGYDVGVLTYVYPGNDLATSANTTEIYGALSYGPATLKYSHSVTNLFGFADSKNSGYVDLSRHLPGRPGCRSPRTSATRRSVARATTGSYTDYALTVGYKDHARPDA